jgi:hypothetical protein
MQIIIFLYPPRQNRQLSQEDHNLPAAKAMINDDLVSQSFHNWVRGKTFKSKRSVRPGQVSLASG